MTNVAKEFRLLLKSVYLLFSPVRSNLEESGLAISGSEIVTQLEWFFSMLTNDRASQTAS